ncbi:MAG: Asp-tRNA(Asn)/Glu-tRNA(Gln) amidotransferase subunit GatB [Phycisphaerales bacterium]|nr:Asp-tRNA(Asn)/Glu-tRNA(Gln) amidotransferase subunit GatB [Phycisphaerales bacterium]
MPRIANLEIQPIIGLEIHVQLATRTKMFCACAAEFGAEPNTRACPVCLGLPGALPVVNAQAIELAIRAGAALNCSIARLTKWDRKSYYYPDLPKNYQISQFDLPIAERGWFEFSREGETRRVRIRRAHLEEDAGKNVHDFPGFTAVDLNRAGTPLLEIVTEPDIHCAEDAREFAIALQREIAYLGIGEANMQKGQMRFEPNINLEIRDGEQLAKTPIVEVKNLNSFRSLHGAIEFEIRRQLEEWQERGVTGARGNKSNRGWDDVRMVTVAQREKEEADDYRYFPDPDLPPVTPDARRVAEIVGTMPEPSGVRTARFIREYQIPAKDAPALVDDRATADLLDAAAALGVDRATLARQFLSFWQMQANARQISIAGLRLPAGVFAELAQMSSSGRINATAAATIAGELVRRSDTAAVKAGEPLSVSSLAAELGLLQTRDSDQIAGWVDAAFAANAKAVQDALANPKKLIAARGFLAGQVMKASGGKADPKIAGELIEQKLRALAGDAARS